MSCQRLAENRAILQLEGPTQILGLLARLGVFKLEISMNFMDNVPSGTILSNTILLVRCELLSNVESSPRTLQRSFWLKNAVHDQPRLRVDPFVRICTIYETFQTYQRSRPFAACGT
jgi:hypothetical protein